MNKKTKDNILIPILSLVSILISLGIMFVGNNEKEYVSSLPCYDKNNNVIEDMSCGEYQIPSIYNYLSICFIVIALLLQIFLYY